MTKRTRRAKAPAREKRVTQGPDQMSRLTQLAPAPMRRAARAVLGRRSGPASQAASGEPQLLTSPRDPQLLRWPLDHYYSPIPDSRALAREPDRSRVWPPVPRDQVGIDWREAQQVALVREAFGALPSLELPLAATGDPHDYHTGRENDMFSRLDAWMLQAMLRHFRPRRMIEVGCGWSSLLTARINREHLDRGLEFTCIEPHPPDFLAGGVDGISELIPERVEEVGYERFTELSDGDVLFIDTSHVAKTGGDVVFLYHEVIPRLAGGVLVHIHDIFLPRDYPEDWVFGGRAWNEQYLVQSFLTFNSAFDVVLGVAWLTHRRPDVLRAVLPDHPDCYRNGGGSLWIRRVRT